MLLEPVRRLYAYNAEMTERLLDTATDIDAADFTGEIVSGQRSIRETFVHVCSAQSAHLATWSTLAGAPPWTHGAVDPGDVPDVAALRDLWSAVRTGTDAFLVQLRSDVELEPVQTDEVRWHGRRADAVAGASEWNRLAIRTLRRRRATG